MEPSIVASLSQVDKAALHLALKTALSPNRVSQRSMDSFVSFFPPEIGPRLLFALMSSSAFLAARQISSWWWSPVKEAPTLSRNTSAVGFCEHFQVSPFSIALPISCGYSSREEFVVEVGLCSSKTQARLEREGQVFVLTLSFPPHEHAHIASLAESTFPQGEVSVTLQVPPEYQENTLSSIQSIRSSDNHVIILLFPKPQKILSI